MGDRHGVRQVADHANRSLGVDHLQQPALPQHLSIIQMWSKRLKAAGLEPCRVIVKLIDDVLNPGCYTLPTLDLPYPDGLGGIGLIRDDVVRFVGYPLVVFSGDRDIGGTTENFPKHESAMAQGPNRFERARFFLEYGQATSARLGVPCRWSRVVVPGVAHEGMRMSAFAAQHWFDTAPT